MLYVVMRHVILNMADAICSDDTRYIILNMAAAICSDDTRYIEHG